MSFFTPLYLMAEVRAITPSRGCRRPSCVIISSVIPSLRYCCSRSPLMFSNGRTASMILPLEGFACRQRAQTAYAAEIRSNVTANAGTPIMRRRLRARGGAGSTVGGGAALGNLVDSLHRSDEAIAAAGQGLDVTGLLGGIRERLPDPPDAEGQALLEIHEGVAAPDFPLDLLSGNDLATVSGKQDQDFEGLPLQVDHPASLAQLGPLEI